MGQVFNGIYVLVHQTSCSSNAPTTSDGVVNVLASPLCVETKNMLTIHFLTNYLAHECKMSF